MGYGLVDIGRNTAKGALSSLSDLDRQEQQRKQANERLKEQKKGQRAQMAGTGAMLGTYIAAGTSVGGPYGAIIGGLAGLAASYF